MPQSRGDWITQIIEGMFLPYRTPNRVFTIVGGGLAAVAFGALIILCIPWMRVYIDCHAGIISHDAKTREVVKNWCDFTIIVFQILIFLVVGGTLFTDELARGVNRHLAHIVTAGDDYWTASELDIKARVLRHIDSIRALRVGLTTLNAPVRFIKTIWMVYRVLRIATQSLPRHTAAFLSVRLVNRWQSGAPGFFAFVLIFVWLALQVAKTYYDYSAECS